MVADMYARGWEAGLSFVRGLLQGAESLEEVDRQVALLLQQAQKARVAAGRNQRISYADATVEEW